MLSFGKQNSLKSQENSIKFGLSASSVVGSDGQRSGSIPRVRKMNSNLRRILKSANSD